jgi:expansin (peptidoglycan-binding protein)
MNPTSTACTIGPSHNGDGSFTYYYFAQGTGRDGNGYRTACGYYGTANGMTDTVENIANTSPASNTYFAAIPADSSFNTGNYCGACVEITGQNGTKIIATVIDACPTGSNPPCQQRPNQHLDLSKSAFDRLGYSVGNPTNTTWRFVPCPVSGNVKVRFKSGNNNEIFIENGITAIATVTINGTNAVRTSYGAWHVDSAIATPATLNLTDKAGRTITVTLSQGTQNQDSGKQFPLCQ